ncbi:hypothetical protein GQ600_26783 [Phytophthora cactorum]|nr:hypothetical protein GQ600_26783 [Phytophthora cactorum]
MCGTDPNQIQNFVYNYRRRSLKNTDVVRTWRRSQLEHSLPMSYPILPFTFGYPLDDDGAPALGDGSDDDPLVMESRQHFCSTLLPGPQRICVSHGRNV